MLCLGISDCATAGPACSAVWLRKGARDAAAGLAVGSGRKQTEALWPLLSPGGPPPSTAHCCRQLHPGALCGSSISTLGLALATRPLPRAFRHSSVLGEHLLGPSSVVVTGEHPIRVWSLSSWRFGPERSSLSDPFPQLWLKGFHLLLEPFQAGSRSWFVSKGFLLPFGASAALPPQ